MEKREEWKDGKKDGKTTTYKKNSVVLDEDIWKDGECVEMCEWDD